jgi:hypothetical protein
MTIGFAAWIVVAAGLFPNLLVMFERFGVHANVAVTIIALIGPLQVIARLAEMLVGRDIHPLMIVRISIIMMAGAIFSSVLLGFPIILAIIFSMLLGMTNGWMLVARGTLPLALFGPGGYGRTVGRIAGPMLIVQSIAPSMVAILMARAADTTALALVGTCAMVALICFTFVGSVTSDGSALRGSGLRRIFASAKMMPRQGKLRAR